MAVDPIDHMIVIVPLQEANADPMMVSVFLAPSTPSGLLFAKLFTTITWMKLQNCARMAGIIKFRKSCVCDQRRKKPEDIIKFIKQSKIRNEMQPAYYTARHHLKRFKEFLKRSIFLQHTLSCLWTISNYRIFSRKDP